MGPILEKRGLLSRMMAARNTTTDEMEQGQKRTEAGALDLWQAMSFRLVLCEFFSSRVIVIVVVVIVVVRGNIVKSPSLYETFFFWGLRRTFVALGVSSFGCVILWAWYIFLISCVFFYIQEFPCRVIMADPSIVTRYCSNVHVIRPPRRDRCSALSSDLPNF